MNTIETQIERMFRDIPESRRKKDMMLEITQNLNEKVADLVSQGRTEGDAVKKAFEDFGDIGDIRRELTGSAELAHNRKLGLSLAFSIWGFILISALVLFINFYYTPGVIWFIYPVFATIWWPMSVYFTWRKHRTGRSMGLPYSVASFILITALMLFINYYYTPAVIWFVYPVFATIWWPVAMFFNWMRKKERGEDLD